MTAKKFWTGREDQVEATLWGQHPFLREFSEKHQVPLLGTLGGPETMYPDFLAKLKDPSGRGESR